MLKFKYLKFLLLISTVYSLENSNNTMNNTCKDTDVPDVYLFRNEKYIDGIMLFLIILFIVSLINMLIYKLYFRKKILPDTHSITIATI